MSLELFSSLQTERGFSKGSGVILNQRIPDLFLRRAFSS